MLAGLPIARPFFAAYTAGRACPGSWGWLTAVLSIPFLPGASSELSSAFTGAAASFRRCAPPPCHCGHWHPSNSNKPAPSATLLVYTRAPEGLCPLAAALPSRDYPAIEAPPCQQRSPSSASITRACHHARPLAHARASVPTPHHTTGHPTPYSQAPHLCPCWLLQRVLAASPGSTPAPRIVPPCN